MRDIKKKKMEVSQNGVHWTKRYVHFIPVERDCYAVEEGREEDFLNDRPYMTERWKHCREIKEDVYRAFNPGEMPANFIDGIFREKGEYSGIIYKPSALDTAIESEQLRFSSGWYSNDAIFKLYERMTDRGWVPVGVKL